MSLSLIQTNDVEEIYEECLEGDYVVCSKCDGLGDSQEEGYKSICTKCWGDGKLDWIENIMGKECPFSTSGSSSSISSSSTPVATQHSVKKYIDQSKRRIYEHDNSFRGRAVQRFHKVFNKSKGRM